MDIESASLIRRFAIILFLLWAFASLTQVIRFGDTWNIFARTHGFGPSSGQQKLSAAALEADFIKMKVFGPESELHCEPSASSWDYVCVYKANSGSMRVTGAPRLKIGVNVDSKRWLETSRIGVPLGADIPP